MTVVARAIIGWMRFRQCGEVHMDMFCKEEDDIPKSALNFNWKEGERGRSKTAWKKQDFLVLEKMLLVGENSN